MVVIFRRPLYFLASFHRGLDSCKSLSPRSTVEPYHELSPSRWIEGQLHGRLWVKGFVANRIPSFVFRRVYVTSFPQHKLATGLAQMMACLPLCGVSANPKVLHGEPVVRVRSSYEMIEVDPSPSCKDLS